MNVGMYRNIYDKYIKIIDIILIILVHAYPRKRPFCVYGKLEQHKVKI